MTTTKKDSELKIRLSLSEKENLKNMAESSGMSMSDFARNVLFSEEKVILLSEGASIAEALFHIQKELTFFHKNKSIPKETTAALLDSMEDINSKLFEIAEKITEIRGEINE